MTCSASQFHRNRFMFMALLSVGLLIGCQGTLAPPPSQTAPAPSATLTPRSTATATQRSALGEAPEPLTVTPWPPVEDEILGLFDYDHQAPLDIEEVSVTELSSYINHELTYASPKGGRVPATLLVPIESSGPFAGIILMHGLPGDRSNNALFARGLVATGAVVLMIDAPFARPENRHRIHWPLTFDEVDRLEQIQLMIDLRRGVDLLSAREDVDPERLAYIGYSYGGAMGGLLAGIEPRIKAFGLMVGDGGIVSHFTAADGTPLSELNSLPDEKRQAWLAFMEPIEPIRFVGRATPGSLFFQNALRDQAVMQDDALAYQAAGSGPKRIEWYESDHFLPDEAFQHMVDWLGTEIGLDASLFTGL
jgi:uncharacterized protein